MLVMMVIEVTEVVLMMAVVKGRSDDSSVRNICSDNGSEGPEGNSDCDIRVQQ